MTDVFESCRATLKRGVRAVALGALALNAVGCKSYVNASPNLRWWLFSNYGVGQLCPEIMKRSAPLRMSQGQNVIGRFFPKGCQATVNDPAQTVTLSLSGSGFAWTPIAGRTVFSVSAVVEYRMDFNLAEDADYVWARTNQVLDGPNFQILSVENRLVNAAAQSPLGFVANTFGAQIVANQLTSGFTVVRTDNGDEFSLGQLNPPARPARPFTREDDDRYVYVNESAELHPGQADLLGPFEVPSADDALFLRLHVQGPALELLVIGRDVGDLWFAGWQQGAALGPPPGPPLMGFALQSGVPQNQRLPLAPGQYYLVIDHSAQVGRVNPPLSLLGALGANTATVSYSVELGDAED